MALVDPDVTGLIDVASSLEHHGYFSCLLFGIDVSVCLIQVTAVCMCALPILHTMKEHS